MATLWLSTLAGDFGKVFLRGHLALLHGLVLLQPASSLIKNADNPFDKLGIGTFLGNIQGFLVGIGATVFIIGIIIGGLMRMTAFGSERRIAASNIALSCAIVGFIIVIISTTLSTVLQNSFPGK